MKKLSDSINRNNKYKYNIPPIEINEISIIIPVKNNQLGINRFINTFFHVQQNVFPKEIIIVDNNSTNPVKIDKSVLNNPYIKVIVTYCKKKGPAAARNHGVMCSTGIWVLFTDSDCIPTNTFLSGYLKFNTKAIGYTGIVKSLNDTWLDFFYNTEEILLPHRKKDDQNNIISVYIVTANALVLRSALIECNGFNENFDNAAGEDVEIAIRLWKIGNILHNENSLVSHDFGKGLIPFYRRFYRYGRGNKQLEILHNIDMKPIFRKPKHLSFTNYVAKMLQYISMFIGYKRY